MNSSPIIRIKNLVCGYHDEPVLDNFNLTIHSGDILGLAGPNGAGKSTLIKAIMKIIPVTSGEIQLNMKNLTELSQKKIARSIAVVPQETAPVFKLRVYDILAMGRTPYMGRMGFLSSEDKKKVADVASLTGISHLVDRFYDELSGGEKQLVIVSRCLIQDPDIILLDEATAHLDIFHEIAIIDLIRQINREHGITIVFVTHDINHLIDLCSNVVFIKEGANCYEGPVNEVVNENVLRDIYSVEPEIKRSEHGIKYVKFHKQRGE